MDTHADTCVAGKNWAVLTYSDVVCEVQPFTDKYDSIKEVPIVTACTVWTDQNSGKEHLLVGEQFLWFGYVNIFVKTVQFLQATQVSACVSISLVLRVPGLVLS